MLHLVCCKLEFNLCVQQTMFTSNKKIRRPLHKLNGKERILGSMGDCPAFIVQATNHINMIGMKQCQSNAGLARNIKNAFLTFRQGLQQRRQRVAHPNLTFVTVFIFLAPK